MDNHNRIETLLEISKKLANTNELIPLLSKILTEVQRLVSAEASSLLLRVPGTDLLEFFDARGQVGNQLSRQRIPIGTGISGEAALKREVINVISAWDDSRFMKDFDIQYGFRTRQVLSVPIVFGEDLIGVMCAINKLDNTPFSREDENNIQLFSDQAGIAIHNCHTKDRYVTKNKALLSFAESLKSEISKEVTVSYGYLDKYLRGIQKQDKSPPLPKELCFMRQSLDAMSKISKLLGLFSLASQFRGNKYHSMDDILKNIKGSTLLSHLKIYAEKDGGVNLCLPVECLPAILENLLEDKDPASYFLYMRHRSGVTDVCICTHQESPSFEFCENSNLTTIIGLFDGDVLYSSSLKANKVSHIYLQSEQMNHLSSKLHGALSGTICLQMMFKHIRHKDTTEAA